MGILEQIIFGFEGVQAIQAFWPAAIGGIATLGGAAISTFGKKSPKAPTQGLSPEMLDYIKNISVPTISEREYDLGRYSSAGTYSPELEDLMQQEQTELANYTPDLESQDAQYEALRYMQNIADEGGLDATAEANYNRLRNEVAGQQQSAEANILADAARRGVAGSGLEQAARLQTAQSAANASGQRGLDIAAQAQQRALEAMRQSGQMGTEMRSQDFGEQRDIANAADAINRFNTQGAQSREIRNVGAQNVAQQYNLGNEQSIMDKNVGQGDVEEKQRVSATEGVYQDQLEKAKVLTEQANSVQRQQQDQVNAEVAAQNAKTAGIGGAIKDVGVGIADYLNKKDDEE